MFSIEAKKTGRPHTPNRQGLYAKTAKHAVLAIETIIDLLNSKNENIRLGAARTLLDKCLPDVKASEILLENTRPLQIIITYEKDFPISKLEVENNNNNKYLDLMG